MARNKQTRERGWPNSAASPLLRTSSTNDVGTCSPCAPVARAASFQSNCPDHHFLRLSGGGFGVLGSRHASSHKTGLMSLLCGASRRLALELLAEHEWMGHGFMQRALVQFSLPSADDDGGDAVADEIRQ